MLKRGDIVFIDANAIVAAHNARSWGAIRRAFKLITAKLCTEEATQANRYGAVLVDKTAAALASELDTRLVDDAMRYTLRDHLADHPVVLDAGEEDLVALTLAQGREVWCLCGPDKATLRALHILGWSDRMVALEEMMSLVGMHAKGLDASHTKRWLEEKRTRLKLGDSLI